ncbi:hypothetical protein M758_10G022500 [Ceratodon purpureus]|nr:hypothetical protein M758_10G022500 [Ceratodon purpureus]
MIECISHSTQIHHSSTVFSHFFLRDETTPSFSTSPNVTQTPRFVLKCNESTRNQTRRVHNHSPHLVAGEKDYLNPRSRMRPSSTTIPLRSLIGEIEGELEVKLHFPAPDLTA